jgi:hypothetical protein
VKEATKNFADIMTFKKSNKKSPVLQQMLKILTSCPNNISILADHVVYSLEFLPGNWGNLAEGVLS